MTNQTPATVPLKQHRQAFPGLADKAYFNFGGQGTMPQASLKAIYQAYEFLQEKGPFSRQVNDWIEQECQLLRHAIASELRTSPATITLTDSVTTGCNIVLWGIQWQAGDHILITDCEHPGIIASVKEVARRFSLRVSTCPIMATLNRGNPSVVIEQHLQPNTRLVVLSHVLWNSGQVLPLPEIIQACRTFKSERPIQILVDAAQSVGQLPLNLSELAVDFYAFTGHKWLCGPAGVGGLYVHPHALEELNPTFIGWRSITMDGAGMPTGWQPDGRRFEVATTAYPQYAGLRQAIATHQAWGPPEERYTKICYNSEYLWQGLYLLPQIECLRSLPPESGLVSFRLTTNEILHPRLAQALEQQGFFVRTLKNPDCIRACVHYLTLPSEMDQLIKVLGSL
ncbi:aminotransferase class V-fold PLP-dependent enzyme [Spirulina subsalsa]|uniref:aminotransferase class V-fold PLP-dependent enzyme n=1 Tax=Spirulina subsalsa TaxID=54311 RepID=UPI0002FF1355|nr:aminotransferase class V-fold PLP-dependent enzyme [Spirulina subsalsa]